MATLCLFLDCILEKRGEDAFENWVLMEYFYSCLDSMVCSVYNKNCYCF